MVRLHTGHASSPKWHDYFALQAEACRTPALECFYKAGLPAGDTPVADVSLMAMDFETTGLDPARDAIVSIGMVPFDLQRIRPSEGRYWVVRPAGPLREESIAFHRITHSQVAQAPPLEQVFDDVLDSLRGHLVVVHYSNIERPFLDAAAMALHREHCLFPLIDTMALEARRERQGRRQKLKRLLGIRPRSIRLADTRARYGLPVYSAHHAKVDAMATAELFVAQMAKHYSPRTPIAELWG